MQELLYDQVNGQTGQTQHQSEDVHKATTNTTQPRVRSDFQEREREYDKGDWESVQNSVRNLVPLGLPFGKGHQSRLTLELDGRQGPIGMRQGYLSIKHFVVKPGFGCIPPRCRKEQAADSGPIRCAQAHWTRFATGVEVAAVQSETVQTMTGFTDGNDFSVGRGVVRVGDLIPAASHDFPVLYHHGTKRPSLTPAHRLKGQPDRLVHEDFVHGATAPVSTGLRRISIVTA